MEKGKDLLEQNLLLTLRQKSLWESLTRVDKKLGDTYLGALGVLSNSNISDRFALCAHSFRELTNLLTRYIDLPMSDTQECNKEKRSQHEKLKVFIKSHDVLKDGTDNIAEMSAKQWVELHRYFVAISHHEKEVDKEEYLGKLDAIERILLSVVGPSYVSIAEIDDLVKIDSPSRNDADRLVALIKKQAHYEYFFEKIISPIWFGLLKSKGFFSTPPEPIRVEGYIRFPIWPESKYLIKIAKEKPKDVLDVMKETKNTENIRVHEDYIDAALNMPPSIAKEVIPFVGRWIRNPYHGHSLFPDKVSKLVLKLSEGSESVASFELASCLLEITIDKPKQEDQQKDQTVYSTPEPRPLYELWHYEQILKNLVPKLSEKEPIQILRVLCKKLSKSIRKSNEARGITIDNVDSSFIWRPAIEDNAQNWSHSDVKVLLLLSVRDLLVKIANEQPDKLGDCLCVLRESNYPIFLRLELFTLQRFPNIFPTRIEEILNHKEIYWNPQNFHEFYHFLRTVFMHSKPEVQDLIVSIIEQGPNLQLYAEKIEEKSGTKPSEEELIRYKELWKRRLLTSIEDNLSMSQKKIFENLLEKCKPPEYPDFLTYHDSWVGPTSPLSNVQLKEMNPQDVLRFLFEWEPPQDDYTPSPEGLGRFLKEDVKNRAKQYANIAPEFFKRRTRPVYLFHLLEGFSESCKGGGSFIWEHVIELCLNIALSTDLYEPIPLRDKFEANWHMVRKAIGSLLAEGFVTNSNVIPFQLRDKMWKILESIVKDQEPDLEYEQQYGGDNMDAATMSINTARGQAMHAIFRYGLWCAKNLLPDEGSQTEQVSRMVPEVKEILTRHLDIIVEPAITIHSVYGFYFPNLVYLDKNWVIENLALIFPHEVNKLNFWQSAWETYVVFCPVYNDVYSILRAEYDFAISRLTSDSPSVRDYQNRLVEHLITVYLRGKEPINEADSLIKKFFETAREETRAHAITFVGRDMEYLLHTKASEDVSARFKRLWEYRLSAAEVQENERGFGKEFQEFGWWFINLPLDKEWMIEQLSRTLQFTGGAVRPFDHVVESLRTCVSDFPIETITCLNLMVRGDKEGWNVSYKKDDIKEMLKTVMESHDEQGTRLVIELIDYLISKGYYDFRNLFPPNSKGKLEST